MRRPAAESAISRSSRRKRVASCLALITKRVASLRYPGGRAR